jgi:acetylornithine deacetylase
MLFAFLRLVRERPTGSASVVLVFTVDEEYTHTGSSALAHKLPVPQVDLAIVAEPTRLNLVTTHKGAVRWRIAVKGKAAHSATPQLGDNAIYRMARVVTELERQAWTLRESEPDEVLGTPSLSVGTIAGGVAANIVAESCVIEIDRRLIPGEHPDGARQQVIDRLNASLSAADGASLEFEQPWVRMPALRADVPPEMLQILGDVIQKTCGRRPDVTGVPFGTDAGPLGQAGVKCVVFGPGDIAQAHTKDEWVELAQVHAAAEAYYQMAIALG